MASEKPVMLLGIDDSEQSFYALEWAIDHFFIPFAPNFPFKLCLVHSKPTPMSAIGFAGPGMFSFFDHPQFLIYFLGLDLQV